MVTAAEALERLKAGNRRHAGGVPEAPRRHAGKDLVQGQRPFAAVLGCADSRVCPESVFDLGPGELFVIRVAGGIAGELELGSMEYAVTELGVRLAVVLGHTGCGAVRAALEHNLPEVTDYGPWALPAVVRAIRPNVAYLLARQGTEEERMAAAVRANARANTLRLTRDSSVLSRSVERGILVCVTAEYDLATGLVTFFDDACAAEPNPI